MPLEINVTTVNRFRDESIQAMNDKITDENGTTSYSISTQTGDDVLRFHVRFN